MEERNLTVCIPTKNRESILSLELASLVKYKDLISKTIILNTGEPFCGEELKQMFGIMEQEEMVLEIYVKPLQLLEAREFLWSKVETKHLWMMDDDMFISMPLKDLQGCLNLLEMYDVVGFMVPNGTPPKEVTEEFVDKFHRTKQTTLIKPDGPERMIGGIYLVNTKVDGLTFKNELKPDEPGEDRLLFENVRKKVLCTKAFAYHMTSKKIGSNFDYQRYFGEENMMWKDK